VTLFFNSLKVKKFMKNELDKEKTCIKDSGNLKSYLDLRTTPSQNNYSSWDIGR